MVGESARWWWVVAGRMLTHPCRLDISDDGQGGVVRAFLLHCSSTSKCRTCCCKWLLWRRLCASSLQLGVQIVDPLQQFLQILNCITQYGRPVHLCSPIPSPPIASQAAGYICIRLRVSHEREKEISFRKTLNLIRQMEGTESFDGEREREN